MKKKILFYINSMNPSGGIERVVSTIANKLSSNYSVTILVKDSASSFYSLDKNVTIESLNSSLSLNMNNRLSRVVNVPLNILRSGFKLREYLKNNSFDYCYITHPINFIEYNISGADCKKLVISEHGSKENYNNVYKLIKKIGYKRCRSYCVPTRLDYDGYKKEGFPVVYTPHFRPELGYNKSHGDIKTVLNIGRYTEDKQQILLLECWKELVKNNKIPSDWNLNVVGCGELKTFLKSYIDENDLNDSVCLLEPTTDVSHYYSSASLFTLTSRSEGFGMVLLEAVSFGLPCVSFNCPSGPKDIINDGYNGYLVELNDKKEFMKKLSSLINNDSLRKSMGTNAFQSGNNWNDKTILENWLKVFR